MKKKICYWLNSKQQGNIVMRHGRIAACCTREVILSNGTNDYSKMSFEDIQNKRIALYNAINNDTAIQCRDCGCLVEMDEENIEIGKLGYLIFHPHSTCNLSCCYCNFAQNGAVLEKFDENKYDPLAMISHFHDIGLFKDDIIFEFGGGEPLLLKNIPQTIEFLSENYPKSCVLFVSNFALKSKVKDLIPFLKNRKIKSVLKTSIDCGTRETYKKIRGRDVFDIVKNNLINSAKEGAFDEIMLKYIFLEDGSNSSKKDIEGFKALVSEVKKVNPHKTIVIIDADQRSLFNSDFENDLLNNDILKAAATIYYHCIYKLNIDVDWIGERLAFNRKGGKEHIEKIQEYAVKLAHPSFIQQIFSIMNEENHKVIRLLGAKIKFKRRARVC